MLEGGKKGRLFFAFFESLDVFRDSIFFIVVIYVELRKLRSCNDMIEGKL